MESTWKVLVSCLFLIVPATAYSNGKVTKACRSMEPKHGHKPQPLPSPYSLTLNTTEFKPGDKIKVDLSGSSFKGFLIEARDAENLNSEAIGTFSLIDSTSSQLLNCAKRQNSAVSHTSSSEKGKIEVIWNSPRDAPPHVQFLSTVVKTFKHFWVKIPSPLVSQPNAPPLTTPPLPTAYSSKTDYTNDIIKPFNASGCGTTKSCVRNPSYCNPEKDRYCFFLSFTKVDQAVRVELSGPGEGYIAFAFSDDKLMGNDDTYLCIKESQQVNINPAFLTGRKYPSMESKDSLQDMAWRLADGVIQCSFRRNISIPGDNHRFSLNGSYYIFLADGLATNGMIHRHNHQPLITDKKLEVTGPAKNLGGARSPLIIKFHGAFMFIAWMTTVSIGVIVARFFKPVWPDNLWCGQKVWFQVHRTLMIITIILTCSAFVLPFLYRGGWSTHAGAHPFVGCVVMALAVLQPIMAFFRPHPGTPRRSIFNWAHWGTGTVARVTAVAAMFLGMNVQTLDLPNPWDTYMMVGLVLWHVLVDIILEVHNYFMTRKEKEHDDDDDRDNISFVKSAPAGSKGHTFKKVMLSVYICGNLAFLSSFLATIIQI
ncbi:putative ferric-chelate reductase 1 isoform X2 [Protopterus annectens]|uniref:putative ferric-chelate reductase 1 isoform X2 n=1 Tax=Protopterus annectens TaxID=7888 RepID=UPI001CFC3F59|nr:putative ferric-chelate reductase 1 isoform X2 [Protopterus annectens]